MEFELGLIVRQITKNLVGADMVEALSTGFERGLEEADGAFDIGLVKEADSFETGEGAVNVGFGGEMDNAIDPFN